MKTIAVVLAVVCAALLVEDSSAQFGRFGFGRFGFGGFGMGFGFRRMWGPWGFGGMGPWGFGGMPMPIPVPVPVPAPMPLGMPFGKRSADENATETGNLTTCSISTISSSLSCITPEYHFECMIVPNLGDLKFAKQIDDLKVISKKIELNGTVEEEVLKYDLVSFDKEELNDFTVKLNETSVLLSLYWSESIKDLGFRVKNEICWGYFEDLVKNFGIEDIRFGLILADEDQINEMVKQMEVQATIPEVITPKV